MRHITSSVLLLIFSLPVAAASVSMNDYSLISNGMSEAEVLYRLGPYDHETVSTGDYNAIRSRTWYYIPAPDEVSNLQWITEIRFDGNGRVISRERYKPGN